MTSVELENNKKSGLLNSFVHLDFYMVSELGLSGNELLFFSILVGFCQDGCFHNVSNDYLYHWTGLTQTSLWRICQKLEKKGLIFVKRKPGFNNQFSVNFTKIKEAQKRLIQKQQEAEKPKEKVNMLANARKEAEKELLEEQLREQDRKLVAETGMTADQIGEYLRSHDWTFHE